MTLLVLAVLATLLLGDHCVIGGADGDEFRKELGEQKLAYEETLSHYVIAIHKNQVSFFRDFIQ